MLTVSIKMYVKIHIYIFKVPPPLSYYVTQSNKLPYPLHPTVALCCWKMTRNQLSNECIQ